MERKGTDPDRIYLQPHTPSYQLMAPGTAATAGACNSDSPGLSHYSLSGAQISSGRASQSTDSAYNSEHERTPEQDCQPPKQKKAAELRIVASPLQADLWRAFNKVGNEMIVTKPGR